MKHSITGAITKVKYNLPSGVTLAHFCWALASFFLRQKENNGGTIGEEHGFDWSFISAYSLKNVWRKFCHFTLLYSSEADAAYHIHIQINKSNDSFDGKKKWRSHLTQPFNFNFTTFW